MNFFRLNGCMKNSLFNTVCGNFMFEHDLSLSNKEFVLADGVQE